MNICTLCKNKDGSIIHTTIKYKDKVYRYYCCHDCNNERARNYRKTEKGKSVYRQIMRRQYLLHRDKIIAREKVNRYLKKGKLKKSNKCFYCSKKDKLEAHHPDYTKQLEVVWVCRNCHTML